MESNFLSNRSKIRFIERIINSLSKCRAFYFSVSFIKNSGLTLIVKNIESALRRGAKGKIITSTYQNFTDIAALNTFLGLMKRYDNFECYLEDQVYTDGGFHAKGYLFEYDDYYELIVGSSNITSYALLKNIEWNVSVEAKGHIETISEARKEFDFLKQNTEILSKDLIDRYKISLEFAIEKWDMDYIHSYSDVKPNFMQKKALKEIRRYRDLGVKRALIVAATGSGKTYLAAFDAKNFGAKKILFVVHRESILNDALKTFSSVFGSSFTYGMFTGTYKDIDAKFLFATNLTISRSLHMFKKDHFDYIIIDEVHHAVAETYTKIIEYFEPLFLLGLTATPMRMDGGDVVGLFESNIPYELSLREALLNQLVVPFKYYGIRLDADYSGRDARKMIREILDQNNIERIVSEINLHMSTNGKLKALCFCRDVGHANLIAERLYDYFNTLSLTGLNSTGERIQAFKDLQDESHQLNIICTVDILNEGVDIPGINMVIFLRPTESQTVFIQQLGRGLRIYEGKEYLSVLDFIGNNYERSIQIAKALGSLSNSPIIEKPLLRTLVRENFKQLDIPGIEINIDEISKDEIIRNIDTMNFNRIDFLKKDYENFKTFINSITYPTHMDYLNNESAPDIIRLINSKIKNRKNGSYYSFLLNIGESVPELNQNQIQVLKELSDILPLVRPYEFEIIKELIIRPKRKNELERVIKDKYPNYNQKQFNHALSFLCNKLFEDEDSNKNFTHIVSHFDQYRLTYDLYNHHFKSFLIDLLNYGISRYKSEFGDSKDEFTLYRNYTTKQVKMVMCKPGLMEVRGTVYGDDGKVYLLVNLEKDLKKNEQKRSYKFLSPRLFQWESETRTTLTNVSGEKLLNASKVYLFVRKVKVEDGITMPFTFMGTGTFTNPRVSKNKSKTLLFDIQLDNEVPENLRYDFNVPE